MLTNTDLLFFKVFFFNFMWTVLKALLEFMTVLLLFHVLVFFGHKACGNLSSLTRD